VVGVKTKVPMKKANMGTVFHFEDDCDREGSFLLFPRRQHHMPNFEES